MNRPLYLQRPIGTSNPSAYSFWKDKGCPSCITFRVIAPHRFNPVGSKPCEIKPVETKSSDSIEPKSTS